MCFTVQNLLIFFAQLDQRCVWCSFNILHLLSIKVAFVPSAFVRFYYFSLFLTNHRPNRNQSWFYRVSVMVCNTNLNNISVISWLSVLLVEETGGPGENHRPVASYWPLSHNVVSITPRHERDSNSQLQWL